MKARQAKKLLKWLLSGTVEVRRVPPGTAIAMYYPRDWREEDVADATKRLVEVLGCPVMPLPRGLIDVEVVETRVPLSPVKACETDGRTKPRSPSLP